MDKEGKERRRRRSASKLFVNFKNFYLLKISFADADLDELDLNVVRYKPMPIDALARKTHFTRKELQVMYRGFKQVRYRCLFLSSYFFSSQKLVF